MALGAKTGGRQKGTPNKISSTVRENVVSVFDDIGGVKNMVAWAKKNATEFYRLYSRLLPTEATVNVARNERELTDDELSRIAAASSGGTPAEKGGAAKSASVH